MWGSDLGKWHGKHSDVVMGKPQWDFPVSLLASDTRCQMHLCKNKQLNRHKKKKTGPHFARAQRRIRGYMWVHTTFPSHGIALVLPLPHHPAHILLQCKEKPLHQVLIRENQNVVKGKKYPKQTTSLCFWGCSAGRTAIPQHRGWDADGPAYPQDAHILANLESLSIMGLLRFLLNFWNSSLLWPDWISPSWDELHHFRGMFLPKPANCLNQPTA